MILPIKMYVFLFMYVNIKEIKNVINTFFVRSFELLDVSRFKLNAEFTRKDNLINAKRDF